MYKNRYKDSKSTKNKEQDDSKESDVNILQFIRPFEQRKEFCPRIFGIKNINFELYVYY